MNQTTTKLFQALVLRSGIYNSIFRAYVESSHHDLKLVLALIAEMESIAEIHFEIKRKEMLGIDNSYLRKRLSLQLESAD